MVNHNITDEIINQTICFKGSLFLFLVLILSCYLSVYFWLTPARRFNLSGLLPTFSKIIVNADFGILHNEI